MLTQTIYKYSLKSGCSLCNLDIVKISNIYKFESLKNKMNYEVVVCILIKALFELCLF